MRRLWLAITICAVAGCQEQAVREGDLRPVTMTEDAVGHYCQMIVANHEGPKAQVHLAGDENPIWFVQIRDALAFDRMPEQSARVVAIFVSDMGAPQADWHQPGADNWIDAADAHFVVGSTKRGGMGAPDFIPFGTREQAESFRQRHGGKVVAHGELTDEMVLAPVDVDLPDSNGQRDHGS